MIAMLVLSSAQDLAPTRTPYILLSIIAMCIQIKKNRLMAHLRLYSFNESSKKFKKYHSNKCMLANCFFKPTDKTVSSVTHRTYSSKNYEKSYVTCSSSNIICLIICSNCFMQYVGETAQQLKIKFATHRASMSKKIKSDFCKWLAEHF